jgi:hypothetical protein
VVAFRRTKVDRGLAGGGGVEDRRWRSGVQKLIEGWRRGALGIERKSFFAAVGLKVVSGAGFVGGF